MILPPRGVPVDTNCRARLRETLNPQVIVSRIDKLVDQDQIRLTDIFSHDDAHQLCDELQIKFRERDFTPAITLGMLVSQCLSRGDACSTTVTKFNRERKRLGQAPCSEDASAYCKARAKLPVTLIDSLGQRVVDLLRAKAQTQWKWRGLNVYLVDGLVFRAPDTQANQNGYPQPSSQKEGLGFPQVRAIQRGQASLMARVLVVFWQFYSGGVPIMPRPPRADEAGGLYHALNRGNLGNSKGSGLFDGSRARGVLAVLQRRSTNHAKTTSS